MSKNSQFHFPDEVVVRVAEFAAPHITRSDLERALVKRGLYSLSDFSETNYGWNKKDFITYTLLENSYSRNGAKDYLGVLKELLPVSAQPLLDRILVEGGIILHPSLPRKKKPHRRPKLVPRQRRRKRRAHKREIFLAHSSADHRFVTKLATGLTRRGVRVWLDKWEIKVGDSIVGKVQEGLRDHSYLGVVLSRQAVRSAWVKRELSSGLVKELRTRRVTVLPIVYENCKIPPLLEDKRYADFRKNYRTGLSELLEVLQPDHPKSKSNR